MPSLARGQASSCGNPILDLFTMVNGAVTDVAVLEFQIWDVTGTPTQVYPGSGRQAVDLDPCPDGERLGLGHYVAEWTPGLAEPLGDHEIRWFFKLTALSPELTFTERFSVVPEVTAGTGTGYCTVQDLRDEGVPSSGFGAKTDAQLLTLIERVSARIDRVTGRFFEPRPMVIRVDGTGRGGLLLGHPIISISQIRLISNYLVDSAVYPIDLGDVRIYNRHLGGLLDPDDRDSPKVEWITFDRRDEELGSISDIHSLFHPHRWPEGTQNVEITGVFGYTDPDGSPTGRTPIDIRRAAVLMVLADLDAATSDDRSDRRNAWRLTSLRTRDQSITWADPNKSRSAVPYLTGDPEVDLLLAPYVRPPLLGAA